VTCPVEPDNVAFLSVVELRWPAPELSSGARGGEADSGTSAVEAGLQLRGQGEHLHEDVGDGQRWRVEIFADCQSDLTAGQSVQQLVRVGPPNAPAETAP